MLKSWEHVLYSGKDESYVRIINIANHSLVAKLVYKNPRI